MKSRRNFGLSLTIFAAILGFQALPERTIPQSQTAFSDSILVPISSHHSVAAPATSPGSISTGDASIPSRPLPAPPNPATEPKFARFLDWLERYESAESGQRLALEQEGLPLVIRRREELEDLIPADPKRAIELSIPSWVRATLPAAIQDQLEEPFSARGHLMVRAALPLEADDAPPPVERLLELGESTYRAHVYGRRLGVTSRSDVPLHGIVLGDQAAIHEDPVRVASAAEAAALLAGGEVDPVCGVSGQRAASPGEGMVVEVAGEIGFLCGPRHVASLIEELVIEESARFGRASEGPLLSESAYTEGLKNLILIRVDFSDLEGVPYSDTQAENLVNGLSAFYKESSFGRTDFRAIGNGSDATPTLRMPRTTTWYGTNDASRLRTDARAAARAAGYDLTKFNFDIIWFKKISGFKWSGLGFIGSAGAWVQDTASVGVAAHELGHNFGLEHANFWDTSGNSVIGAGTSVEYGDKFDTMGSANAGSKHFNARYKSLLNWIPTADVITPSTNGLYRLFPHDDPAATGVRAIRLSKSSGTNYWIELRQRYSGNKWLAEGVTVRWSGTGSQATRLLDMTPGSVAGKDDAALLIGRTFSDRTANLHITPVGKGGTSPESIDVVVQRGPFPLNGVPTVRLVAPTLVASLNAEVQFSASASDPDGDLLAYFWDFGDSNFSGNTSSVAHRWSVAGEYVVRCEVSDMRGGRASAQAVVRVGNPATFRISGRIIALDGSPIEGVRIAASSTQMAWTGSDGRYDIAGLVAGTYSLKVVLPDYAFNASGFSNPVSVGPSKQNVDYVATPPNGIATEPLITAGSVWQYLDDGSNQGTAWRTTGFDDSAWKEGAAPLGYGDDNEKTGLSFGPNSGAKFVTTYFRRSFSVPSSKALTSATLGLRRDDGAVVYLDGREIFRSNMPSGTINSSTLASSSVGGTDEQAFFATELSLDLLKPGEHLMAVEIHQASRNSSDIVFDLELLVGSAAAASPPLLAVELSGLEIKASWPDSARSWSLQALGSLDGTESWTPVPQAASLNAGRRVITIPVLGTKRFFRLADQVPAAVPLPMPRGERE